MGLPKTWGFLLPIIFALSSGCTKREPMVAINDWWNVDFVKNSCEPAARNGSPPCVGDPVEALRDFEAQLRTSFASDPACHEVFLTSFGGSGSAASQAAAAVNSKADWELKLNFQPDDPLQDWMVFHRADHRTTIGHGSPTEIVRTVCDVVKQVGGSVAN